MKKLSYIIASASFMLLSLTGCSDFLEAENKSAGGDKTEADSYFRTKEGLESFRAYAFSNLKNIATAININDDGTDLYMPCRGQGASVFQDYSVTSEFDEVKDYYVACTGLVNNANGLINYSGSNYPLYRAEGLFLRALGYYYLTQHFGAVPYSDSYIQDSNRNYPRVDLETIYTNCENDLNEIINSGLLPEISHDGSVNKKAAQALLAKIYLAHGWDCNTTLSDENAGTFTVTSKTNFEKAAQAAEAALSGISLTQPFEQKWAPSNEDTNPETFFAVQYDKAGWPGELEKGAHKLSIYYSHYYGDVSQGQKYSTSNKALNTRSLALWEKGDERWAGTFMTTMYQYDTNIADWATKGYFAYYNTSVDKNTLPIFAYFAPSYVTQAEFEAYLTAHKAQFARNPSIHPKPVHANLLLNGQILIYNFDNDGTFKAPNIINQNLSDNNRGTTLEVSPCVKKWDDPTAAIGGQTLSFRDIVLLHASELYLTAAEAYYMADNEQAAWSKISAVRDRAHAPHLNSLSDYDIDVKFSNFTLLDLILDERARECYAEQTRWMDLRRTKQLVRYNVAYNIYINNASDMQNVKGETKWYHPIPSAEISSNDGLTLEDQNPGY